jgi:hypothetical protein
MFEGQCCSYLITYIFRGCIVRRFKNKMLKLKRKMTDLVIRLFGGYLDMRKLMFKWRLDTKANRWLGDAKTIHDFVKN